MSTHTTTAEVPTLSSLNARRTKGAWMAWLGTISTFAWSFLALYNGITHAVAIYGANPSFDKVLFNVDWWILLLGPIAIAVAWAGFRGHGKADAAIRYWHETIIGTGLVVDKDIQNYPGGTVYELYIKGATRAGGTYTTIRRVREGEYSSTKNGDAFTYLN
mgnify:CR=1 FL=1